MQSSSVLEECILQVELMLFVVSAAPSSWRPVATRVAVEIQGQGSMQSLYWGNEYIQCDSRHKMGN